MKAISCFVYIVSVSLLIFGCTKNGGSGANEVTIAYERFMQSSFINDRKIADSVNSLYGITLDTLNNYHFQVIKDSLIDDGFVILATSRNDPYNISAQYFNGRYKLVETNVMSLIPSSYRFINDLPITYVNSANSFSTNLILINLNITTVYDTITRKWYESFLLINRKRKFWFNELRLPVTNTPTPAILEESLNSNSFYIYYNQGSLLVRKYYDEDSGSFMYADTTKLK